MKKEAKTQMDTLTNKQSGKETYRQRDKETK